MRTLIALALFLLTGCGERFVGDFSQGVTRDEMLRRAEFVFVGVIEEQKVESPMTHRAIEPGAPADKAKSYRVVRHRVYVETVLRGTLLRGVVDVYEVFRFGGSSGDWNAVGPGARCLFLVRTVNGRLRVVRDYWRSIFPVSGGPHERVPLGALDPLWERVALMNFDLWGKHDLRRGAQVNFFGADPGHVLGTWRRSKLLRGLLRHPSSAVRVSACRELLRQRSGEDSCWGILSASEKQQTTAHGSVCCTEEQLEQDRGMIMARSADWWWSTRGQDRDGKRSLTAVNIPQRRAEICALWNNEYPDDHDSGCPPSRALPATVVTPEGDIPIEQTTLPFR